MSDQVREGTDDLAGRHVRLLSRGTGSRVLLMLHTGAPAASPFCGSSDLFTDLMEGLELAGVRTVAPDLPGAGGTDVLGLQDLLVDGIAAFIADVIAALGPIDELHLLAHGQVSLAALKVAREGASGTSVSSCFLIAPNSAAPIGDSVQNVSLLNPPAPAWSRRSQNWALRRLAYLPDRVPASLLERMVENAESEPHRKAVELLSGAVNASTLYRSQLQAQNAFYAYCRDEHYSLPLHVFWGAQDPTATVARGTVLTEILSGGPAPLQFDLVNQCGHLAQFDRPYQLARALETFVARSAREGVDA